MMNPEFPRASKDELSSMAAEEGRTETFDLAAKKGLLLTLEEELDALDLQAEKILPMLSVSESDVHHEKNRPESRVGENLSQRISEYYRRINRFAKKVDDFWRENFPPTSNSENYGFIQNHRLWPKLYHVSTAEKSLYEALKVYDSDTEASESKFHMARSLTEALRAEFNIITEILHDLEQSKKD